MKPPGRPSQELQDFPMVVDMAERWCGGHSGLSVSKISRIVVGLEAAPPASKPKSSAAEDDKVKPKPSSAPEDDKVKPKPSSEAKRLERRFRKLIETGDAVALSVNRVLHQERLVLVGQNNGESSDWIKEEAIRRTILRCGVAEEDVITLSEKGAALLSS